MNRFPDLRSMAGAGARGSMMLALGGALLLTACGSKPSGQVAAKVDGDEITTTELNAELQGVQVPKGADTKALQRQALKRVIDRKLLANAARQDNLDQSPEFVVRRQQLEDALLVQLLTQKIARGLKAPTPAAIEQFKASNANMFAARAVLAVDQIRFATPTQDAYLKELGAAHSMAEVIAVLDRLGIKYQRANGQIDTAQMPGPMLDQIRKLPPGEPFVVPTGQFVVVSLVTGSKPAPAMDAEVVRQAAMNGVRNTQLGDALKARLDAEQKEAKIEYQPGFAPTPDAKPGAAAAAK